MTVLFITRKYPPSRGGMESFSVGLIQHFESRKFAITYGGSQRWLLGFYAMAFIRALFLIFVHNVSIIHLGDGVLAPMGWILKTLTRRPVVVTVHGKDVTFPFFLYQRLIVSFFKTLDHVVAVSSKTEAECLKRGIPRERCSVIPNGVFPPSITTHTQTSVRSVLQEHFPQLREIVIDSKPILLSVGRFSKRKGTRWFLEEVFPQLSNDVCYFIVGKDTTEINDFGSWFGTKKIRHTEEIQTVVQERGWGRRVFLFGEVSSENLELFYHACDIFLMPNIEVEGDFEGFGIVGLEAAIRGLPVIASNLEGIQEAIHDRKNGLLVSSRDAEGFRKIILGLLEDSEVRRMIGEQAVNYTAQHFSWQAIARRYAHLFDRISS